MNERKLGDYFMNAFLEHLGYLHITVRYLPVVKRKKYVKESRGARNQESLYWRDPKAI
jgi:hypothetical protein